MRHLFRFVFIFFLAICIVVSGSLVPLPRQDVRIVKPLVDVSSLCTDKHFLFARSRKLICLICKGFHPECFGTTSTTTTSTSTTTTSTTTPTTTTNTTPSSTTAPTTTTSTTTTAPPSSD